MVFRVISYDGASYRTQLADKDSRKRRKAKNCKKAELKEEKTDIFPVVTFVIYYGEEEWKYETTLHKRLKIKEAVANYVSDYKVNLIDLKKLSEDDINKFKKDFRLIADYMVKGRKHSSDAIELNHPEEVSELLMRLTGEELSLPKENVEGGKNMEKFFEPMFERAEERGKIAGKIEGKIEGENCLARLISLLISEGKNDKIKDVVENEQLRHGLYKEYGIQ